MVYAEWYGIELVLAAGELAGSCSFQEIYVQQRATGPKLMSLSEGGAVLVCPGP